MARPVACWVLAHLLQDEIHERYSQTIRLEEA